MERDSGGTSGQFGGTGGATEQAKQQGQQYATQARQQATKLANQGGEQVKSQLANQKHQAAQRIAPAQTALRETAHQLRSQGQGPSAEYVDKATDQVERFSGYLRETDVDEIIGEARGLARRRPALFLGGAATLGFLTARFLKSSSQEQEDFAGQSYGTREPAAALPPGGFEGGYPISGQPLSEGERTRPPEGPSMSPRGY